MTFPNAGDARLLATSFLNRHATDLLERAEKAIREAATKGAFKTYVGCTHFLAEQSAVKEIERHGFKVTHISDQRDGDTYDIDWSPP